MIFLQKRKLFFGTRFPGRSGIKKASDQTAVTVPAHALPYRITLEINSLFAFAKVRSAPFASVAVSPSAFDVIYTVGVRCDTVGVRCDETLWRDEWQQGGLKRSW